ncbi:ATP-dependent 6-phosphofructokinase-like [Oppia nitens]|uniref:ATP-dependent 6-phosphofructokinase-like n=1 Tax=Oppia nitens TaxID=1686743 RepID=UPI0023DA39C6|nr:ATP-dependent 6-phosphofructokinase-like [Oppia nitens]
MAIQTQNQCKVVGILSSGGDSQGMNAIIRAVVKMGHLNGFKVYFIYEGYNGLIDSSLIIEAETSSVDHIINKGGTIIGSSRCKEFRTYEGRVMAALTLIEKSIMNLIVIGGDGSLTGANILREEWPKILKHLLQNNKITQEMKENNSDLNIIGIVGSIDNDFCMTDITTGADTALYRIVEAVDAIATTATSHKRVMIIEVMGRNCGYLALVSALALEATFTFFPEKPPNIEWPEYLTKKIDFERKTGRRLNLIIVSEGALDVNGNPITAEQVKKVISEKAKRDVRITILGHTQRGGETSAYDRILGTRMGYAAIEALKDAKPNLESYVLTIRGNQIQKTSLIKAVEQTREVGTAMKNKDWPKCLELRGRSFQINIETFLSLYGINKEKNVTQLGTKCFAVIQVGEPSPGMNAAVLSFVRHIINDKNIVFGIKDGFDGLIAGDYRQLNWSDVNGWTSLSGALLGTSKVPPRMTGEQLNFVANYFNQFQIKGLLIIGGFRAFQLAINLGEISKNGNNLKIPICIIPATIDNNIPGTAFSLGTDSSLNEITHICTKIMISLKGTKRRLYIVKIESGFCGYLTVMSAMASGADFCYPYESNFSTESVKNDANIMTDKMKKNHKNRLIIVNSRANTKLDNQTIEDIYTEVGNDIFTTHCIDLNHLQQSLTPSPFDRIFGIKLGYKCAEWLSNNVESDKSVVIGIVKTKYLFTDISELIQQTDFEYEIPKNQWFMHFTDILNKS